MLFFPIFIFVRGILNACFLEFSYHTVKFALPKLYKPLFVAKAFYECRADCVVCANKQSAIPSRTENVVANEVPFLWPPDVKSRLIRKDPDAGKD